MTLATLVAGADSIRRESAVADLLDADMKKYQSAVLIAEGLPDRAEVEPAFSELTEIIRLAPGCVCCTGNLALRVTLNRVLRRRPERLFISVANAEHLDQLRSFLLQPPYQLYLCLTPDLVL